MASTSQFQPPEEQIDQTGDPGEYSKEIARLRERFSVLEQIDAQTTELLARLAEVRAIASLEVATSVSRVERMVAEKEARQRSLMTGLLDEMAAVRARASELAHVAGELEQTFAGVQARLQPIEADVTSPGDEQIAPIRIVPPPNAARMSPLPLRSLFIEIEAVPSVALVLSLQRFIAGLPGVVSALTREYAADIVRFETQVLGRITAADIEQQSQGGLTSVDATDHGLRFALSDPTLFIAPV